MTGSAVTGSVVGEGGGGAASSVTGLTDATSVAITGGTIAGVTLTTVSVSGGVINVASLTNCAITSCSASGGLYVNPVQDSPNWKPYTTTTPSAPATGSTMFSRNRTGRNSPAFIPAGGAWADLQSSLGMRSWWSYAANPGVAAAVNAGQGNSTPNLVTSYTAVEKTTTSLYASLARTLLTTPATSAGSNGAANNKNSTMFWRGNAAGLGGFFLSIRFGIETPQTGMRFFVGLRGGTSGDIGNVNPSTVANIFGVGIDAGQTTLCFLSTDNSATLTSTDLGSNFPATTGSVAYEFRAFCFPNDTKIYYSVERLDAAFFTESSESTNLFSNTTFANFQIHVNNGTTPAAVSLSFMNAYAESAT